MNANLRVMRRVGQGLSDASARRAGQGRGGGEIRSRTIYLGLVILLTISGCDRLDMYDEPRFEPLEASTFFDDGTSARPLVAGTVARGDLREDEAFYSGKVNGKYVTQLPLDLDRALLARGQERFNIYCSPCHGRVGDGNGMIVERGFRRPPSFVSTERLLNAPVGHFYDVISNGFGAMPSYASRVPPHDRWAIVAYIRALQRSQNGSVDDVPPELREAISESESLEELERQKREAAERLDRERQQKLQRDIREHRVPPEEGERRHREIERQKREEKKGNNVDRARFERRVFVLHSEFATSFSWWLAGPDIQVFAPALARLHKNGQQEARLKPAHETLLVLPTPPAKAGGKRTPRSGQMQFWPSTAPFAPGGET